MKAKLIKKIKIKLFKNILVNLIVIEFEISHIKNNTKLSTF